MSMTPTTPDLGSIIESPKTRKRIYVVWAIVALVWACLNAGFATLGGQPEFIAFGNAVLLVVAGSVSTLSAANTSGASTEPSEDQEDESELAVDPFAQINANIYGH